MLSYIIDLDELKRSSRGTCTSFFRINCIHQLLSLVFVFRIDFLIFDPKKILEYCINFYDCKGKVSVTKHKFDILNFCTVERKDREWLFLGG